jgi:murein DD-endopeptidase MepM/ murein hydrolase activator NlpD
VIAIAHSFIAATLHPSLFMSQRSRRRDIQKAAKRYHIGPKLLWGVYGAESSWGKAPNSFGLVSVPQTGSFKGDANSSASTIRRLLNTYGGSKEKAFRAYSGNGYGIAHVRELAHEGGGAPPRLGGKSHGHRGSRAPAHKPRPPHGGRSPKLPRRKVSTRRFVANPGDGGQARTDVLKSFVLSGRHDSNALLNLASSLKVADLSAKPTFGTTKTVTSGVKGVHTVGGKKGHGKSGHGSSGAMRVHGGTDYPLGKKGNVIGLPYQGTHTLGNWESDNAVDLGVPKGTPVYAVAAGTIGSQIGSLGEGGQFAGLRLHLMTKHNEYYYAHLSKLSVHAGEHVKKGALLGYSGEANGVQHLHFARRRGDPRKRI